eukprot:jgi/Mesen1/6212/ME000320S05406
MSGIESFPAGLRVLVVDDDPLCLMILERMLRQCSYAVTTCSRASSALSLLRENRDKYDLVISDVYMPDMDGFKLLELIGLEMDLPVIMMSANGETSAVMKGITHGACDYLLKPVRIEELRNIWQHVLRKKSREVYKEDQTAESDGNGKLEDNAGDTEQGSRKRKEKTDGLDMPLDDSNSIKKARVVWSIELHQQFVNAVNQLDIDKAVPKRILEIMNVQGLTRENVASHLQKYRLYLKRLSGVDPQPHPVASFQASDGIFGGSMQIHPGGRSSLGPAGKSAMNLGQAGGVVSVGGGGGHGVGHEDGSGGGGGGGGMGLSTFSRAPLGDINAATLQTLAQLQALHQRQQSSNSYDDYGGGGGGGMGTSPGGSGLLAGPNVGLQQLQGLSSYDLNMLMQAQQETAARHRPSGGGHNEGMGTMHSLAGLDSLAGGGLRGSLSMGGMQVGGGGSRGAGQHGAASPHAGIGSVIGDLQRGGGSGNVAREGGHETYGGLTRTEDFLNNASGQADLSSAALLSQLISQQHSRSARAKYEPFQS